MKLAKQIILLTASLVLAMGLSFTLISGIVIGSQTSVKSEKLTAEITYTTTVDTAKATKTTELAAAGTDAARIKAANDKYDAAVTKAKKTRDSTIADAKKAAFKAAFYQTKTSTTLSDAGTRTGTVQVLTPMGALMVSGIAMTFIGGGLVLTVVLLNKLENAPKTETPKTSAKKAA